MISLGVGFLLQWRFTCTQMRGVIGLPYPKCVPWEGTSHEACEQTPVHNGSAVSESVDVGLSLPLCHGPSAGTGSMEHAPEPDADQSDSRLSSAHRPSAGGLGLGQRGWEQ